MWTKAFIVKAIETALVAGGSAFIAADAFVATGTWSWKKFAAAGVAAASATVYSLVKQFGGAQAIAATKVGVSA